MTVGQPTADDLFVAAPPRAGAFPVPDDRAGPRPGNEDHRRAADTAMYEVLRLKRDVQDGHPVTPADIEALIASADEAGFPEVARAAMALDIVRLFVATNVWPNRGAVERLMERAISDDSAAGIALALALRGQLDPEDADSGSIGGPDDDLTRASVLLEDPDTVSLEGAAAHIECARAYAYRALWELELDHYQAADAASASSVGGELMRPAILYNIAETQLNWCASLRERGPDALPPGRVAAARAALRRADIDALPGSWRDELRTFGTLLDAIADPGCVPDIVIADPDATYAGYLQLARALSATELDVARPAAGLAVAQIDSDLSGDVYRLALCIAAELEAVAHAGDSAGLHWARELVERRWQTRLSTLAVMRSRRDVERMRREHALLDRHAHVDELTGLANRRGLLRYSKALEARVATVALALLDLDDFKGVNDRHGHHAGDEALRQVGRILRGSVREDDLAARLGGDEFLLVLPLQDTAAALRRCEEIIAAIVAVDWDEVSPGLRVSVSAGVATGHPSELHALSARADAALYRCKAQGGNRAGH